MEHIIFPRWWTEVMTTLRSFEIYETDSARPNHAYYYCADDPMKIRTTHTEGMHSSSSLRSVTFSAPLSNPINIGANFTVPRLSRRSRKAGVIAKPCTAMAENAGLENHRIKSFKNKGRDVEVRLHLDMVAITLLVLVLHRKRQSCQASLGEPGPGCRCLTLPANLSYHGEFATKNRHWPSS